MQNNYLIEIAEDDLEIFKTIISTLPYTIYAYGSRVKNRSKKFSDIDLCIIENITDLEMSDIKEIFEESNLAMKVDIKRSSDMSVDFFNIIKNDLVLIRSKDKN
jgi:predicted nucleotidyltransferase